MPSAHISTTGRPQPWPVWHTFGISLMIMIWFALAGFIVLLCYSGWELHQNPELAEPEAQLEFFNTLQYNETFLAWNTLVSGALGLLLVSIAIRFKKGLHFFEYLNLGWPKWPAFLVWNALLGVQLFFGDQIAAFFQKKSDFMENVFSSAPDNFVLLFIAVVVMAPLFEEVLFRGFMFKGLENSWLGTFGTVFVTSFAWAIVHMQYDLFFMGLIFLTGILFGYARHITKSLWVPISMHVVNNGLVMLGSAAWLHSLVFC